MLRVAVVPVASTVSNASEVAAAVLETGATESLTREGWSRRIVLKGNNPCSAVAFRFPANVSND